MNIGISGGVKNCQPASLEVARECGRVLAGIPEVTNLVYGSCPGMAHEVVLGYLEASTRDSMDRVIGYSPWSSADRHRREGYPLHPAVKTTFTGLGMGRNARIVEDCRVLLAVGGQLGTLDEMVTAAIYGRYVLARECASTDAFVVALTLLKPEATDFIRRFRRPIEIPDILEHLDVNQVPTMTW